MSKNSNFINKFINIFDKTERKLKVYRNIILGTVLPVFYSKSKGSLELGNTKNEVIVSLTTIPSRIDKVGITIESILRQSYKVDKIILWLDEEKFRNIELPRLILTQQKKGLEIRYCKDLICHTKYYYSMREYPESVIITVDDDILYSKNMIKELMELYIKNKDSIICHRAHKITFNKDNKIENYSEWVYEDYKIVGASHYLLQTGVSGVLYPPKSLNIDTLNIEIFKELCPRADDIWLKIMALINNTKVIKVRKKSRHFPVIMGSQKEALNKYNVHNNGNDIQLRNLIKKYNINRDIFDK